MAIDFPNDPSPGATFTTNSKTWTFTDGKWALNVSIGGVRGPAGVAVQGTAPATTDVLWADTSITGTAVIPLGGSTGQVLAKSSATDYDTAWATPVTSGDMALKADLASPTFTGTPTLPTGTIATTQTAGNSSTAVATTAFVGTAVANLVDSAPATLNTLDELAAALGDDVNFATTTATAIGLKAPLASPALTGTPTAPTAAAGTNTTQIATMASRPWNVAWGQVGYVKKTSVTSIVVSPPVTVFSVAFTAVSGRMYKVTSELYLQSASTNTYINCAIYNGSTRIQGADYYMSPTINLWHSPTLFTYFSGASGSTTISVQCAMGAGTGQVYADTNGYANALMVEDVGPA